MSIVSQNLRIRRVIGQLGAGRQRPVHERPRETAPPRQYVYTIGTFDNSPITVVTPRPLGSFASSGAAHERAAAPQTVVEELESCGHRHTHGMFGGPAMEVTYSRRPGAYGR